MSTFVINGPTKLSGRFKVGGSKNAVLPILASTLLNSETVIISNLPKILDVNVMLGILKGFGAEVSQEADKVIISAANPNNFEIDQSMAGKMRASILMVGPVLGRLGEVKVAHPGGDHIGARPLDTHFIALKEMGVVVDSSNGYIVAKNKPKAADIVLSELSVTATENIVMAAVLTSGTTTVRLAACEPHVNFLCESLNKMGAKITGIGTHTLKINGVKALHQAEITIPPDSLEAGTMAIAAAATRSQLEIEGFIEHENDAFLQKMNQVGANWRMIEKNVLEIRPTARLNAINIRTDIYPGFPTDLQAPMAVLLTQANGTSEIFETLYEGRLSYFHQLEKMGADVIIKETHRGIIDGPTPLYGTDLLSIDVRAGATLVVAAMLAEGTTRLNNIEHIDRGYENFDERLNALGASIVRQEE